MIFPKTEKELEIYILLQEIVRLSNLPNSPYSPENRLVQSNLKSMKEEYLKLVNE